MGDAAELPTAITGVHETVLYGSDLEALTRFYGTVVGLRMISEMGEVGRAFRLSDDAVLLLFDPARAAQPGRDVPAHGARGQGHVAFSVATGSLPGWKRRFGECGIEIEAEVDWSRGGRSLYVRDPAMNSVELIDGPLWPP